jgi:fatty-acid peroxygenase
MRRAREAGLSATRIASRVFELRLARCVDPAEIAHHRVAAAVDQGERDLVVRFIHEVRRIFPFAPVLGARTRHDVEWHGHALPAGQLVIADLYGTDHDPLVWPDPERFDPDRFLDRELTPFDLVPQGGGDTASGHRCAGERLTIEALEEVCAFLVSDVAFGVPPQDLRIPPSRTPTMPRDRMVLSDVRLVG